MKDTSAPHPLLSEAVRKWRGPGTGAPALPLRPKSDVVDQQQSIGQGGATTREFTAAGERVPLKLEPRSVPPGYATASMSVPPGATFDARDFTTKMQEQEGGEDHQPASRFSSLLGEKAERNKLALAPRTKPIELPVYQPKDTKAYDIAKARERMEREKKEKLEKQRKKEEKTKNILASAFASSSDEESDDNSAADSSDWGEEQDSVFEGNDDEIW